MQADQSEQTGYSMEGAALKRHKLNVLDRMRKLMCFLSINTCNPNLVVTQNKVMSLKNEHNMSPLIHNTR